MFWFAIPNDGFRSKAEAAIMAGTGTRAGVPDLCCIHQGKSYFIELEPALRESVLGQVAAILSRRFSDGQLVVPYITTLLLARKAG